MLAGDLAAEPWLTLAEEFVAMRRTGALPGETTAAIHGASASVFIAIDLIGRSGRIDDAQRARLDAVISQLVRHDRERALLLLVQLARHSAISP